MSVTIELKTGQFAHLMYIPIPQAFNKRGFQVCWLPVKKSESSNKKDKIGTWDFYTKSKDGYIQIGTGKRAHVSAYEAFHGVTCNRGSYHVSHLCHNSWCVNPTHLSYELDWINIMRKACTLSTNSECTCTSLKHSSVQGSVPPCLLPNAAVRERDQLHSWGMLENTATIKFNKNSRKLYKDHEKGLLFLAEKIKEIVR